VSSVARQEPEAPEPLDRISRRPRFHLPEELGVLCALLLLVLVIGTHNSDFVDSRNLFNLVASNSFFGMIALSAVFLLALGEIDLSVGWNFNLSAVIAALMMTTGGTPGSGPASASSSAACSGSSTACSPPASGYR
jgi:ribose/xylose/arabinose/galactoside ABC-type transport system permease subunit